MSKTTDCHRCQFYAHNPHLVCVVHPVGVEEKCLDFRPDPNSPKDEDQQWSPEGYYWWDGDLYPIRTPTLTTEEQLENLDSHPFFTGVCPRCSHEFERNSLPLIHWDCPACGWVDDSV